MISDKQVPLKNSIATQILWVVLGLYLLIASTATLGQLWMNYRYQRASIVQELVDFEGAFGNGLAVSLWNLDEEALRAAVVGMLETPTIVGVIITNDKKETVATGGEISRQGQAGNVGLHISLAGCSDEEKAIHDNDYSKHKMFEHQFPLTYTDNKQDISMGRATLFSSSAVIYQRMKVEIVMVVVTVGLTLITFFLALYWAINRYLRRPLGILTNATAGISMDNLGSFSVDTKTTAGNEIKRLEETITSMASNLHHAISKQKESEESLRESEATFRKLFEDSSDAILLIDEEGVFVECNQAALDLLRMTREQFLSLPPARISPELQPDGRNSAEAAEEMIALAYSKGLHRFDWTCINSEGGEFIVEVCLMPVTIKGRIMLYTTWRDITERKRIEADRLSLEQQMQHAQKLESLGVLAGGIAHDFNNLLMAILGNTDLALSQLAPHAPARGNLEEIEKVTIRAADLAKQMLAYSGKGRFVIEPIALNSFVEEMGHLLEVSISKKAVLKYNFADNLPVFDGDATQVRQIIMNLIVNASEAIGDKSGVIALSTGAIDCDSAYLKDIRIEKELQEGLYVYIEVSDTGCGMDQQTIDKIFDPFFTTKFTGRGLGMSAVLGIMRGHKGAIKVYSEVGKGTTFKILFPATEVPGAAAVQREVEADGRKAWRGKGIILIADDEESICAVGKGMLEYMGFSALTAPDGREAVKVFREHAGEIACVLLDLTMPHLDGEEVFREIRRIRPGVPVILCSGYNMQDATQRFAGKGLAGFLQKPYNMAELREKLREVLSAVAGDE